LPSENEAQPSYEESLARLEKIVERLEAGETSLAESLQLFEEGIKLVRLCNDRLEAAEVRIRQLTETPDGTVSAVPFAAPPEECEPSQATGQAAGQVAGQVAGKSSGNGSGAEE